MKQLHLAGSILRMPQLLLAVAVPLMLLTPAAQASNELIPSTEVTVRYDPFGYVKNLLFPAKEDVTAQLLRDMATIEPAAGHGAEPKADGHGDPKATGKSEGKKSFAGKTIGAVPELPTVTIGGKTVISHMEKKVNELNDTTPEDLRDPMMLQQLDRRFSITPYAHSPRRGVKDAKIVAIVFADFSCGQCMPELAKIDAAMATVSDTVQMIHIHAPMMRFQDTNMPAFYGKVASRGNVFWAYREKLMTNPTTDANALFDMLVASGMDVVQARSLMLTDARRFYRELDADSMLARSFSIGNPPVVFINGIRLGYGGIPLDKISDVLAYVHKRIERGMNEPPQ